MQKETSPLPQLHAQDIFAIRVRGNDPSLRHVSHHISLSLLLRPSMMGKNANAATATAHMRTENPTCAFCCKQTHLSSYRTDKNVQWETTFTFSLFARLHRRMYRFPACNELLASLIVVSVSPLLGLSYSPQSFGPAIRTRVAHVDCLGSFHEQERKPFPVPLPWRPSWWLGSWRATPRPTSGGPHPLSPTLVVSAKVHSIPSSPLRSVNSSILSRTAASGRLHLEPGPRHTERHRVPFSSSPMCTAWRSSHLHESAHLIHHTIFNLLCC